MGSSSWSNAAYDDRTRVRAATGTPAFDYDHKVRTGAAPRKVHDKLDPSSVAGPTSPYAGKVMRESRDSSEHPESLAIGVLFDETGSMGHIPIKLQKKLAGLMTLIIQKGYAAHPQLLFGGIGDAYSDEAPLQIGQFESGLEMDDWLTNIWLEGNGGGTLHESYELGVYFFARHTSIDCFEKRGQKGYLFTIGDEMPYDTIHKHHVKALIGDDLEADIPFKDVVAEIQQRYHYFHLLVPGGSNFRIGMTDVMWKDLLGERVLTLNDPDNVAEMIALTIGLNEGTVDIDAGVDHLTHVGLDRKKAEELAGALVPLASAGALAKPTSISGLPSVSGGEGIERL